MLPFLIRLTPTVMKVVKVVVVITPHALAIYRHIKQPKDLLKEPKP